MPDCDGLELLRALRQVVPARQAPAVVIVDSRERYEHAARLMIKLGIGALLSRGHAMPALQRAIRRMRDGAAPSRAPPAPDDLPQHSPSRRRAATRKRGSTKWRWQ
ncbi:MAG: hypothetical protein NVSMB23_11150 [Myxococcales bacterium]